jgi:2-polyprenyl-3-methyl-5-hydroxy-6-metoxy-1,4-benzoquinol methylase
VQEAPTVAIEDYKHLDTLLRRQIEITPQHEDALRRRFAKADAADLAMCDELARDIQRLAGDELEGYLQSYEFICRVVLDEEIYFRRHGKYRLDTFEDALREVYLNEAFMHDYMRGLLVTQIYWANHTASMGCYRTRLLDRLPMGSDLLEIGPGHGLYLARAIECGRCRSVTGWDISPTSMDETRRSLTALGYGEGFTLKLQDVFAAPESGELFDAVVFSEVLEHLDRPADALRAIRNVLRPAGRLFVNVPVNSPAPDHIFLLRSPEEAIALVEDCGFRTVDSALFPMTNTSLAHARKHELTISVCIIAEPA